MKAKRSLTAFILALLLAVGMTAWQAPASAAAEEQNELQVLRVKDWILDVMTEDYYKFEVVFDGDVLPFGDGEEFRMIDGNEQQKAYMDYFKLCGKALYVENDFGHVLFNAGNRGDLVKNAVDLDADYGNAGKRADQDSSQGVTKGSTKASLEGFYNEFTVSAVVTGFKGDNTGLFNFYHLQYPPKIIYAMSKPHRMPSNAAYGG